MSFQAKPKLRELRHKPLQFKEMLDNLFIDNNVTPECMGTKGWWFDTERETHSWRGWLRHTFRFVESFETTMLLDATDMVDELKPARNRKMKRSSRSCPHVRGIPWKAKSHSVWSHSRRWPNLDWLEEDDNPQQRIAQLNQDDYWYAGQHGWHWGGLTFLG